MKGRHIALIVASLLGASVLSAGCSGTTRGTDGETHFLCTTAEDCRVLGSDFLCVQSRCRKDQSPVDLGGNRTLVTVPGKDAGAEEIVHGVDAAPPARDSGNTVDAAADARPSPFVDSGSPDMLVSGFPFFLRGVITNMPPRDDLKLALVWSAEYERTFMDGTNPLPACDGARHLLLDQVEQEAPSVIDREGRFEILVLSPPPPASYNAAASYPDTAGNILVYVDGNHNGKLDFASLDQDSPDTVLGASDVVSNPLDADLGGPSNGLRYWPNSDPGPGFLVARTTFDSAGGTHGSNPPVTRGSSFPITLSEAPRVRALVCTDLCVTSTTTSCPTRYSDLPSGGTLWCFPDAFVTSPAGVWLKDGCTGCRCTVDTCDFPRPPYSDPPLPADWPCPTP